MAPGGVHNGERIREEFTSNIDSLTPGHIIISHNHRPQGPPHVSPGNSERLMNGLGEKQKLLCFLPMGYNVAIHASSSPRCGRLRS